MQRAAYLVGEAFTSLRRNILVVAAAVLAVFVSLALAFGALVFNELVRLNTLQWQEGNHLIVWLRDDVSQPAHLALLEEVLGYDEVLAAEYFDKSQAFTEFRELFADEPALLEIVDPVLLPTSIRIELTNIDLYETVQFRLLGEPAVDSISVQADAIENLLSVTRVLSSIGLGLVVLLGTAAIVLIANTIRMAIYARREEVGIMKLVGAGNWFIRIPFLLEGVIEGILGGALAVGAIVLGHYFLSQVPTDFFVRFQVSADFLVRWGVLFLAFGGLAGFVGSSLGLRRFLKV
ncbi:MAG: permease-like cell division protein FtsX [Acidimicrobiia bacterium]|nr:permease-like cell division protein FtsX [Acidimicrobiia bacterium]